MKKMGMKFFIPIFFIYIYWNQQISSSLSAMA